MKTWPPVTPKASMLYTVLCLIALLAACSSSAPGPTASQSLHLTPPPAQAMALNSPLPATSTSTVVWDVQDKEVVWGSKSKLAEPDKSDQSTAKLDTEAAEPVDANLAAEEGSAGDTDPTPALPSVAVERNALGDHDAGTPSTRQRRVENPSYLGSGSPALSSVSPPEASNNNDDDSLSLAPVPTTPEAREQTDPGVAAPVAENGSYYGEISSATGRPKTVHVDGYVRKDGTYVRGHYRSTPGRRH